MSAYVLTDSDIELLSNFAGALNTGRKHLPPAARFGNIAIPADPASPSIKWSHADELSSLVERAKGQSGYPTRVHADKPLTPGATGYDLPLEPGVVHLFPCVGTGNGGGSQPEGGVGIAGGTFDSDPGRVTLDQLPVQGGRAIYPAPVRSGQLLGILILGDVTRVCRVDVRL